MEGFVKPVYLVVLVPVLFGVIGGVMAANRGRNPLLVLWWSVISALFPIFIMIIYFRKPTREVEGRFKRCSNCGEWLPWRETPCRYCGTELVRP